MSVLLITSVSDVNKASESKVKAKDLTFKAKANAKVTEYRKKRNIETMYSVLHSLLCYKIQML